MELTQPMCANGGDSVVILLQPLLTYYFGFLSDFLIVSTWLFYKKYKKVSNINHYRDCVLAEPRLKTMLYVNESHGVCTIFLCMCISSKNIGSLS